MRLLLLEDAKSTQLLTKKRLEKDGYLVDTVDNGHQGFQLATVNSYDAVISDIQMPLWDGFKFIEAMRVICPHLPIIIASSSDLNEELKSKLDAHTNVIAFLPKPVDFKDLFDILSGIRGQAQIGINKKARIVCTIGPASDNTDTIGKMILAGMDVARLNFSHGTHQQHEKTLAAVRKAEQTWNKPIAVLQDLCGPKIRTGQMTDGQILLKAGRKITIQKNDVIGTADLISTIAPEIIDDLKIGDPILLDDGLFELKVLETGTDEVICEVVSGGFLKSSKGINLPGTSLSLPSVTEKDWKDLQWALNHSVDYVALSFVRTAQEIEDIKSHIRRSGKSDLRVIAKIEKPEAVNNIKDIIRVSDGIMIARGDMGVELPAAKVPRIQQKIIRLCWEMNTPVITATQMLDSMTHNSRPTRAEVTDVSSAINEGTDAVMLSQETATGTDPVNVVRTMASIISEEEHYSSRSPDQAAENSFMDLSTEVISAVAHFDNTAATLLLDADGQLYPILSKWSRNVPSILVTKSIQIARHASLFKNIIPLIISETIDRDTIVNRAIEQSLETGLIHSGDLITVVEGERLTRGKIRQYGAIQLIQVP